MVRKIKTSYVDTLTQDQEECECLFMNMYAMIVDIGLSV